MKKVIKALNNLKDNKELIQSHIVGPQFLKLSDGTELERDWGICIYIEDSTGGKSIIDYVNFLDYGKSHYDPVGDHGFEFEKNIYLNEDRWVFIDWCLEQLTEESLV